jgi:hypothetical protein
MLYSWLHSHLLSVPHNALFKPIFVCQLFARAIYPYLSLMLNHIPLILKCFLHFPLASARSFYAFPCFCECWIVCKPLSLLLHLPNCLPALPQYSRPTVCILFVLFCRLCWSVCCTLLTLFVSDVEPCACAELPGREPQSPQRAKTCVRLHGPVLGSVL